MILTASREIGNSQMWRLWLDPPEIRLIVRGRALIAGAVLCYSSVKPVRRTRHAGPPNRMELTSPTEFVKEKVLVVQDYTLLAAQSVGNLFRKPLYFADMVQQADLIGVGSLPIVVLTGFFTGGVLALQTANTLQRFGSITLIGQLVSTSMVRELGPVLTGLMVAGRNSSGMASELGSMVVTEQIDAMRALGTDPMKKLVTPRVTATVFMLFFLSVISDLVGLAGGLFVAKLFLNLNARQYWANAWQVLVLQDVFMGLLKPVLFGFIIATVGCFYGMTARGGTQGVGRATTQAVVAASVFILVTDFFVTKLLISILSYR
jgi:phospholipid/cholesterol/gamma-HCH transport system permease protein